MSFIRITAFLVLLVSSLLLNCSKKEKKSFDDLLGPDSTAELQNMDGKLLQEMLVKMRDGEFDAIHSIIVVRNGDIVIEEYFRGWSATELHPLYSVTKSVTSILVGIAIDQGLLDSVDQKIIPMFIDEYFIFANHDSLKDMISVQNILTMTHGLDWDWDRDEINFTSRPDWIKHVLDLPMTDIPGTRFNYSSATSLLLSVILQKVSRDLTEDFAEKNLFRPINVQSWQWGLSSRVGFPDYSDTSGGLFLRAKDLANIGVLLLDNGRRGDVQIVSKSWVEESTRTHIAAGDNTEYGYKWWRLSDNSSIVKDLRVNDVFFAWGALGQFLFVIPHLDMVVVSNADNFENTGSQFFIALRDYIFASVKDK